MITKTRRYDLDWLRVGVFALLIFYHVGMFFVSWGWHLKNNIIYDWIRWPMLFLNQWRLPILFVISGMGTYYALSHRSLWQFNLERVKRLLIPLLFGMLVIVPPQIYFERLSTNQFSGSYISYITSEAFIGIYPEGNISWHHLWFLPYLLVFSLMLSPLFIIIKRKPIRLKSWLQVQIQKPYGLYVFILPLYLFESLLEPFFPITHTLIDDWFNFINSLTFFFFGFVLISCRNEFWKSLDRIKLKALLIGIFAFSIQLFIWIQGKDSVLIHFSEAFIKIVNLWSWILVILGYAAKFLNSKSTILAYCNRAVYPFYILHQTITILIGYYIMHLDWNLFTKCILMVLGTFGGSCVLYHWIILRIRILHPFFGLKKTYPQGEKSP